MPRKSLASARMSAAQLSALADGGYGFISDNPNTFANASAEAYRADVSLGLGDFLSGGKGRLTFYTQHLDAGYSAPGFDTLTATDYYGGTFKQPIGDNWSLNAKADRKAQEQALTTRPRSSTSPTS